jgi:hypothetical protein
MSVNDNTTRKPVDVYLCNKKDSNSEKMCIEEHENRVFKKILYMRGEK